MKKKIFFLTLLFAFILKGTNVSVASPVPLYRVTPKVTGNTKPSKAPVHFCLTLTVFFDEDIRQLALYDESGNTYTYYVYDEDESEVVQGSFNSSVTNSISLDLSYCIEGTYILVVSIDGTLYQGEFTIEE